MSANDMRIDAVTGRLVRGALTMTVEQMQSLRESLAADIQTEQDKELPMLKGTGFIVIDPSNPRFTGQEHPELPDAEEEANEVAYRSGKAIIYAAIGIVKPKRDVIITQPSELLKQIRVPVATIPAPTDG